MNWKRASLGVAISFPVLALFFFGMGRDPREIPSPLPGRPAPAFELAVLDGTPTRGAALVADPATGAATERPDTVSLDDMRGNVVVVNFFASWCLACRDEHGVLNRAAEKYADRGVRVVGVVYQDSPENALRWIEQMGGQVYPGLTDRASRTAIDYGLYGVPETFIVAPDGTIAYKHVGPVTDALLEEKIEPLLEAVPQETVAL